MAKNMAKIPNIIFRVKTAEYSFLTSFEPENSLVKTSEKPMLENAINIEEVAKAKANFPKSSAPKILAI